MSEQYEKYLKSLSKKEREKIKQIIKQILDGNLDNISYKELKGKNGIYRTKYKHIRITFIKKDNKYYIWRIGPIGDIYKKI